MSTTLITSRDPKGLKFVSLCEAVYNKARLDEDRAQRLNENGGELMTGLKRLVEGLSVINRFSNEEVASSYAYPKGYRVKGITEQTNILRQLFPGVGFADEKIVEQPLPPYAEGWFAIPKWETMAATYNEAVEKVLAMIGQKRKFYNYREDALRADRLRQHARTANMFQKLGDEQKDHDIIVLPAQFGLRHRGRSVRRAREVFTSNEFGLGAFAVGIMLLTHSEREIQREQLHVYCPGDEYSTVADGRFSGAPVFDFDDGRVRFSTRWVSGADGDYGSASGFLPPASPELQRGEQ